MTKEEITVKLNKLITNNCPEEMDVDTYEGKSIIDDLKFDSIALMQLVTEIEETFGVDMDTADSFLDLLDSYDDLLNFLVESGGLI